MTPIVDGLEAEFAGQATVMRLNAAASENEALMQRYGLRGHPSFVVLAGDGRVSQTFFGPQTTETLQRALQAVVP